MFQILSKTTRVSTLPRRLAADQSGVTAIVSGIAIVALLGFAGLAIDVGKWLNSTRGLQAASDQAAYSAAASASNASCPNDAATAQAKAVAAAHGYTDGQDDTTVAVSCVGSNAFKVTIDQQQPMWFTKLFLSNAPHATRSAAATIAGKKTDLCILALDGTNPSEGFTGSDADSFFVTGSSNVNVQCGVAVDSSSTSALGAGSNAASLTATDIYLVGDDQANGNGFTPSITATGCSTCSPVIPPNQILKNQRPVLDPYANRVVPSHSCANTTQIAALNGTTTLSPNMGNGSPTSSTTGVFCGGITLASGANVTVSCGTYILAGGGSSAFQIANNAKLVQDSSCSTGVTFILTNSNSGASDWARMSYNGNNSGKLVLTAPTTGPYGGMVFFQDRNAPSPNSTDINNSNSNQCGGGSAQNKVSGSGQVALTGAVYFPSQTLCFAGGSSTDSANKCTQIIAYNINFTGGSNIKSQCSGVGISEISVATPQLIQ